MVQRFIDNIIGAEQHTDRHCHSCDRKKTNRNVDLCFTCAKKKASSLGEKINREDYDNAE